jgi:hypothetical protein
MGWVQHHKGKPFQRQLPCRQYSTASGHCLLTDMRGKAEESTWVRSQNTWELTLILFLGSAGMGLGVLHVLSTCPTIDLHPSLERQDLSMQPRLASNSWPLCLHLSSAEIAGMCHHTLLDGLSDLGLWGTRFTFVTCEFFLAKPIIYSLILSWYWEQMRWKKDLQCQTLGLKYNFV